MTFDTLIGIFAKRARGAVFPQKLSVAKGAPETGLIKAEAFDTACVRAMVDRADAPGLMRPEQTGPEHFWRTAAKLVEPGLPDIGPDSFFFHQNLWFDRRDGPLEAGLNTLYWGLGDTGDRGFTPEWHATRVELMKAVNRVFPAADYLAPAEAATPALDVDPGFRAGSGAAAPVADRALTIAELGPRLRLTIETGDPQVLDRVLAALPGAEQEARA